MAHTGPWKVIKAGYWTNGREKTVVVSADGGMRIADVVAAPALPHANLLAAAPTMLDVLLIAREQEECICEDGDAIRGEVYLTPKPCLADLMDNAIKLAQEGKPRHLDIGRAVQQLLEERGK